MAMESWINLRVISTIAGTILSYSILVGGIPTTPLKNDGVKVSWDDDIPNLWKNKIQVPNHQPDKISKYYGK